MSVFMVRCDMEGVSGVTENQQVDPRGTNYAFGVSMLQADLRACIEGLLDGGAKQVVVYDEHYDGRNVDPTWLPKEVSVICGKPPYREDWAGGVDTACAGMVMLGFHSKAGTPNALLAHTYEPDIENLRLNGRDIGEIGMEAAIAGDWGVPLVLLTADSEGVAEGQALIPGLRGVSVKHSMGTTAAEILPLTLTRQLIYDAARQAASEPSSASPLRLEAPVHLEVQLRPGSFLNAVKHDVSHLITGQNTVSLRGKSATQVWAEYWQIKLRAQQRVSQA